jgi:hypothetical protein
MIYLYDIESENLPELLKLYYSIGEVIQVRCHRVLKQGFKESVGEEGLFIACIVISKINEDRFVKFDEILPRSIWDDPSQYEACVAKMKKRIDDYMVYDILPIALKAE